MRSGMTEELRKRLRRADVAARIMVHAEVVEAEDLIDTFDDWNTRIDAISGMEALQDGGLRIFGGADTHIDHGGNAGTDGTDTTITELAVGGPRIVVEVAWGEAGLQDLEIRSLVARLDPNVGAGANIALWHAQLFRVDQFAGPDWDVKLQAISVPAIAAPSGSTPQDLTFALSGLGGGAVNPGVPPVDQTYPVTVVMIWATNAAGAPAADCAWMAEAVATGTSGAHGLSAFTYTVPNGAQGEPAGSVWLRQTVAKLGRFQLIGRAYTQQIATFTGEIDLGAAPTAAVRLIGEGEQPGDSTLVYEVRNDANTAWVAYVDGDLAASLAGVTDKQTYTMRVTLTPSSDGGTTPVARRLGARAVTISDLSDVAKVESTGWAVDPVTLKGEIPEAILRVIRDGERDYRSAIETLLSEHYTGQIEIRLYIGHPALARQYWLHVDTFLIDDIEAAGNAVVLTCVSPLHLLAATIPPYDDVAATREPVEYAGATLKAVWDDLLDARIAVPGRYIGQGVTDATTTVTKTITESRGKDELDAIGYLAGGGAISSQGRVKFVRMVADADEAQGGPVAIFRKEEIRQLSITPGLRARVEEFFVPFGWDPATEDYAEEVRSFNAAAISKLARAYVDVPNRLPDQIARWIASATLAGDVGSRTTASLGTGLNLWSLRSEYAYPELEPGDLVAVETDRFIAADPTTPTLRSIKGPVWALGRVQRVGDVWGREFSVWMQSYATIIAAEVTVTRLHFVAPTVFVTDHQWIPALDASNNQGWQLQIGLEKGPSTESVRIRVQYSTHVIGTGTIVEDHSYNLNLTEKEEKHTVMKVDGTTPEHFRVDSNYELGTAGARRTHTVIISATPYDEPDGLAGVPLGITGDVVRKVPEDPTGTGMVGVRLEDSAGNVYHSDRATLSSDFAVALAAGLPGLALGTTIAADVVNERTAAAGVTIDGVLLEDGRVVPRVTSTVSSATPTPNADTTDIYILTALAADATFGAPTGTPIQGQRLEIRYKADGSAHALAFNAIYRAIGITLPTTVAANKTGRLFMEFNSDDTMWDVYDSKVEV